MVNRYVMSLDAGTSGVHCLIFDLKGNLISAGRQEWDYERPTELAPLGREFSAESFWNKICLAIQQTLQSSGVSPQSIVGISATSQREGVVFLDGEGRELYAGPNIDVRAVSEGFAIDAEHGAEVYQATGHRPALMFAPARLIWFRNNRPEVYEKIRKVLAISDWIVYRLCGERVSEPASAGEIGLLDIKSRDWARDMMKSLDIPGDFYPRLLHAGTLAGEITRAAAVQSGLIENTPVVMGAPDAQAGMLGMGLYRPGEVGAVLGWSAPVQMVLDTPLVDPQARTWTGCHVLPGRWVLESSGGEAGNAYRWLKDALFGNNESSYDEMDRLAAGCPPGAGGVMAFLGPQAMDMSHVGLKYGGIIFPVPLSASGVGKGHLVRSALENLCFALKDSCLQLEAVSGRKISEVSVGGGMVKSHCLRSILPSVLGIPVRFCISEVSGLGAAICAAAGAGIYSNLEEAVGAMVHSAEAATPSAAASLEYEDLYRAWKSTAQCLEHLSEELK